jgi:hypothetical protein
MANQPYYIRKEWESYKKDCLQDASEEKVGLTCLGFVSGWASAYKFILMLIEHKKKPKDIQYLCDELKEIHDSLDIVVKDTEGG